MPGWVEHKDHRTAIVRGALQLGFRQFVAPTVLDQSELERDTQSAERGQIILIIRHRAPSLVALYHQFINRQRIERGNIAGFGPVQQASYPQREFGRQLLAQSA